MNKHTPGPWQVCPEEKEYRNASLLIWGPQGPGYGTVAEATKYQYEAEANAKLIAAAPELLEAAQKVLDECVDLIATDAGNALEAAIAKALGK